MFLVPPAKLANSGAIWKSLSMTAEDITKKAEAISVYKTQMKTLKPLMTAFERKNELLGEYPNLIVPFFNREDSEIIPEDRNSVILDPLQDALNLKISRSADIYKVHTEISKTENLHIFMLTDYNLDKNMKYHINLLFFDADNTSRYDFEIVNGKVTSVPLSKQSSNDISGVTLSVNDNTIHLVLPEGMTGKFEHLYINCCSSVEDHLLDKTAWRMLDR